MLVIGLTGGIGSGKSTIAHLFNQQGVPLIDADTLVRQLTEVGQPAYETILQRYGASILLPDRHLNRMALREHIFSSPAEKTWLESLLHPLVRKEILRQLAKLRNDPKQLYCIVIIPLLFETQYELIVDRTLVIDAPETLQIQRAIARDRITEAQAHAIMDSQFPRDKRRALADDIIVNDGEIADLIPQIDKLHALYTYIASTID